MPSTPSMKELRKFALIAFIFFGVIALLQLRHHRMILVLIFGTLSLWGLLGAAVHPVIIRPLNKVLLKVAHYMGWFNTRLLLGIMFYLVFTPLGLVMRLFGKDLLNRKIDRNAETYWIPKEKKPFEKTDYERQF